jgi:flagellar basal-body rod protein FlgF
VQTGIYVGVSAQLALRQRMDTLANNMANVNTPGFRSEEAKFETFLPNSQTTDTAFVVIGNTFLSGRSGAMLKTDNPLDVATSGDSWFGIRASDGTTAYTKDGRLKMTESGILQTITGNQILDAGGAPIALDPAGGPPAISKDGMITQAGRQVGALGLFSFPQGAKLARAENASVVPDLPANPVLEFTRVGVHQGFIENSNVNGVTEMMNLIRIQREFETVTSSLENTEASLTDAIKALGTTA